MATNVSDLTLGFIFAISSGVYLHITLTEYAPRTQANVKSIQDRLLALLMFAVGAVPIGLTLFNYEHCEAAHGYGEEGAEEAGHEGHDHF